MYYVTVVKYSYVSENVSIILHSYFTGSNGIVRYEDVSVGTHNFSIFSTSISEETFVAERQIFVGMSQIFQSADALINEDDTNFSKHKLYLGNPH